MPKDADKPNVHFSFSQFDDSEVEVFTVMTDDNRRITFPDPYGDDMDPDKAENLIEDAASGRATTAEIFKRWLSKDDCETVMKLNLRRRGELIARAIGHYQKFYGNLGEELASAAS